MQQRHAALWEWSVFWQSDQAESCVPVEGREHGTKHITRVWSQFFDTLRNGALILDLGTGNGSLAAQAVRASKSRQAGFLVHGADLAEIDPARFVSTAVNLLLDVEFHANVAMENLPFADGSFDAVCSQYAIEYSQTMQSFPEALRVLQPAGQFRFLLHADGGVLKARCREQRQQAQHILDSPIFPRFDALIASLMDAETSQSDKSVAAAERAIADFKAVLDVLEKDFAAVTDRSLIENVLSALRQLPGLRRSYDRETYVALAANVENLLLAQKLRLQAMEAAAMNDTEVAEAAAALESCGATKVKVQSATAGEGAADIGYWLHGCKN